MRSTSGRSSCRAAPTSSSRISRPASRRACWSTASRSACSGTASRRSCVWASSRACSRRCPRRRSSRGTRLRLGASVLRRLRISNLVLIREAELELGPGLNAITGETGAGKTILTNAVGLLLGAKGDAALIGAAGDEAYVEAEFDGADDEALGALAELRPEGEDDVVLARRIFADGRTRAYAWGRSAAREDVAGAAEALLAMSGQFEQRRLARASYQRDVLDAFAGLDTAAAARAWRELQAARRLHDDLTRD